MKNNKKSNLGMSKLKNKEQLIDYKNNPKLLIHYNDGVNDAKRNFVPVWLNDEATEWKCVERDAYRAGYRTVKRDV